MTYGKKVPTYSHQDERKDAVAFMRSQTLIGYKAATEYLRHHTADQLSLKPPTHPREGELYLVSANGYQSRFEDWRHDGFSWKCTAYTKYPSRDAVPNVKCFAFKHVGNAAFRKYSWRLLSDSIGIVLLQYVDMDECSQIREAKKALKKTTVKRRTIPRNTDNSDEQAIKVIRIPRVKSPVYFNKPTIPKYQVNGTEQEIFTSLYLQTNRPLSYKVASRILCEFHHPVNDDHAPRPAHVTTDVVRSGDVHIVTGQSIAPGKGASSKAVSAVSSEDDMWKQDGIRWALLPKPVVSKFGRDQEYRVRRVIYKSADGQASRLVWNSMADSRYLIIHYLGHFNEKQLISYDNDEMDNSADELNDEEDEDVEQDDVEGEQEGEGEEKGEQETPQKHVPQQDDEEQQQEDVNAGGDLKRFKDESTDNGDDDPSKVDLKPVINAIAGQMPVPMPLEIDQDTSCPPAVAMDTDATTTSVVNEDDASTKKSPADESIKIKIKEELFALADDLESPIRHIRNKPKVVPVYNSTRKPVKSSQVATPTTPVPIAADTSSGKTAVSADNSVEDESSTTTIDNTTSTTSTTTTTAVASETHVTRSATSSTPSAKPGRPKASAKATPTPAKLAKESIKTPAQEQPLMTPSRRMSLRRCPKKNSRYIEEDEITPKSKIKPIAIKTECTSSESLDRILFNSKGAAESAESAGVQIEENDQLLSSSLPLKKRRLQGKEDNDEVDSSNAIDEKTGAATPKPLKRKLTGKMNLTKDAVVVEASREPDADKENEQRPQDVSDSTPANDNNNDGSPKTTTTTTEVGSTPSAVKPRIKKPKVTAKRGTPGKPLGKAAASTPATTPATTHATPAKRAMPKRRKSKKSVVVDLSEIGEDLGGADEDDKDYCPDGQALQDVEDEEDGKDAGEDEEEEEANEGEEVGQEAGQGEDDEILANVKLEPDSEPEGENCDLPGKMTPKRVPSKPHITVEYLNKDNTDKIPVPFLYCASTLGMMFGMRLLRKPIENLIFNSPLHRPQSGHAFYIQTEEPDGFVGALKRDGYKWTQTATMRFPKGECCVIRKQLYRAAKPSNFRKHVYNLIDDTRLSLVHYTGDATMKSDPAPPSVYRNGVLSLTDFEKLLSGGSAAEDVMNPQTPKTSKALRTIHTYSKEGHRMLNWRNQVYSDDMIDLSINNGITLLNGTQEDEFMGDMNGMTIISSAPPKPAPSKIIDYDDHHTIGFNHEILRPHMIKPIKTIRPAQKSTHASTSSSSGSTPSAAPNSVAQVLQRTYLGESLSLAGAGANGETVTLMDDSASLLPKQLQPSGQRYSGNQHPHFMAKNSHHHHHQQPRNTHYNVEQQNYASQEEYEHQQKDNVEDQQYAAANDDQGDFRESETEEEEEEYESDIKPLYHKPMLCVGLVCLDIINVCTEKNDEQMSRVKTQVISKLGTKGHFASSVSENTIEAWNQPEYSIEDFKKIDLIKYGWVHFETKHTVGTLIEMINTITEFNEYNPDSRIIISIEIEKLKKKYEQLLGLCDITFVSREFAENRGYSNMKDAASDLFSLCLPGSNLIIPWGDHGAVGFSDKGLASSHAYYSSTGNSVGADSFISSYIYTQYRERPFAMKSALEYSCRISGPYGSFQAFENVQSINSVNRANNGQEEFSNDQGMSMEDDQQQYIQQEDLNEQGVYEEGVMQQELMQEQASMAQQGGMQQGQMHEVIMQQELMEEGMMQQGMMQQEMIQEGVMQQEIMQEGEMQQDMLQEGIVQEGEMQEGMVEEGMVQEGGMQEGEMQEGMVAEGMVEEGIVQGGEMQEGMVQEGMVQEGMVEEGMVQGGEMEGGEMQEGMVEEGMVQESMTEESAIGEV